MDEVALKKEKVQSLIQVYCEGQERKKSIARLNAYILERRGVRGQIGRIQIYDIMKLVTVELMGSWLMLSTFSLENRRQNCHAENMW